MTASGRTIGEELDDIRGEADGRVIYPVDTPISTTGGVVGLKGNLAPEGRDREGRRHERGRAGLHRPGAGVRVRGGRLRRGAGAHLRRGRGPGDPQRGPGRRPRHARDAGDHRRALRPGHGQEGGADHRRPLLRRHARLLRRPCRARGGEGRADRAPPRRRHDHHRRDHGRDQRGALRRRARGTPRGLDRPAPDASTARARSGSTPSWSARPGSARSPTPARRASGTSMPTFETRSRRSPPSGAPRRLRPDGDRRRLAAAARVTVAGQAVTIQAPPGFCIDAGSTAATPPAPSC